MITKINNVSIYDGRGQVLLNSSIIFNEQMILAVGEETIDEEIDVVIDVKGLSCLPGMIDMHVHLNMDPTPDPAALINKDNEAMAAYRSLNNAQKHLRAGITTVRN